MKATQILTTLLPALALASPLQQQVILSTTEELAVSSAKKPIVDSKALQKTLKADALLARAKDLFSIAQKSEHDYGHPTRVIGSPGHAGTLEYIYAELGKLGDYYTLSNQSFPAVVGEVYEAHLVLDDIVPPSARAMNLSPPTPNRQAVFAAVAIAANDGCDEGDFGADVDGSIVLVRRGTCGFGDKSKNAGKAGAVAVVVYNNFPGDFGGTLGEPNKWHVPTFGISLDDATKIIDKLLAGDYVDGSAYMDSIVNKVLTTNIVAQTTGGDQDNCVMLGGHSDSVGEGPGINDDGTGSLTLLEIATQLAAFKVNNCVRFAWWAGEEEGLLGSDWYVAHLKPEENKKIRLFMDYDMLASPNFAYQVYDARDAVNPPGSQALRDLYTGWYEDQGLNWTYIPFDGRSDYDAFIKHGIPGGGIATGAEKVKTPEEKDMFGGEIGEWYDKCYHQLCDDVSNCNMEAWEVNAKV
jgi:aminopeptidase Y